MSLRLRREYTLKFYLNAQHYIVLDGTAGQVHPHTWEFCLTINIPSTEFIPFHQFEKPIDALLEPLQNAVLNDIEPFNRLMPTLENLVDLLTEDFQAAVENAGGNLLRVEGSEGPTRMYRVNILGTDDTVEHQSVESVIDSLVKDILK